MSYLEEQPKQNNLLSHAMLPAIWPIEKQNLRLKPLFEALCIAVYRKQCESATSWVRGDHECAGKDSDWLEQTAYDISANQRHAIPNSKSLLLSFFTLLCFITKRSPFLWSSSLAADHCTPDSSMAVSMSKKKNSRQTGFSTRLGDIHAQYSRTFRKRPPKKSSLRLREVIAYQRLDHIGSKLQTAETHPMFWMSDSCEMPILRKNPVFPIEQTSVSYYPGMSSFCKLTNWRQFFMRLSCYWS